MALLNNMREYLRRPTSDVLKSKERVLANLRAERARGEKLARLQGYDEWGEFVSVLEEQIEMAKSTLRVYSDRKFLTTQDEQARSLVLERKECYERIRGIAQSAQDRLQTLEAQIAENQEAVDSYRERLGA
jgi:hypothetical protein